MFGSVGVLLLFGFYFLKGCDWVWRGCWVLYDGGEVDKWRQGGKKDVLIKCTRRGGPGEKRGLWWGIHIYETARCWRLDRVNLWGGGVCRTELRYWLQA